MPKAAAMRRLATGVNVTLACMSDADTLSSRDFIRGVVVEGHRHAPGTLRGYLLAGAPADIRLKP